LPGLFNINIMGIIISVNSLVKPYKLLVMNISYSDPLSGAWNRMKKALFQPFDMGKWFTVGFTSFLAMLVGSPGGPGGSSSYSRRENFSNLSWYAIAEWPAIAWEWLVNHPVWFTLIIAGVFFLFTVIIVLTWLSSRGKFMFMDNVVHNRAEVSKPWNEFTMEGNSLFIWRLVFGFICAFMVIISIVVAFLIMVNVFTDEASIGTKIISIAGIIFEFFILIIIISFISLLLNDFVVPIMYKHRINATQAWLKFLPLLFTNFWDFIVYALFVFVLLIITVIAIVFFGLFTCCIGFLLLIIPYIGSVTLLPVSYTFRAFSMEFLGQYGNDFIIFPKPEASEGNLVV